MLSASNSSPFLSRTLIIALNKLSTLVFFDFGLRPMFGIDCGAATVLIIS